MRRLSVVAVLAAAVVATMASEAPLRAAETGTIEGRVVNGTTGRPQPGVDVTLTIERGSERTTRKTVTSDGGGYSFQGLDTGDETFYALDAVYKDGLFAGRPLTIPANTRRPPVIDTTLRVFEPTTDPNAILIRRNNLFVLHNEDRVSIVESVKVINPTKSAYIGRGSALGGDEDGATPSLGFAVPDALVPETFRWIEADLDVPQAVDIQGVGFGITTAIPPGEIDFTFTYQVAGEGGTFDLSRRALYEVSEMSVYVAEPLAVESNRLEADDEVEIEGTTYRKFTSADDLDAADPVQILVVGQATPTALIAGLAAGLFALVAVAIVAVRRSRRSRRRPDRSARPETQPAPDAGTRERLVAAIAELDLRYEAGELEHPEYEQQRDLLKGKLREEARGGV